MALRMEKILPKIIHESQTGYAKGRHIGESIRMISDIMSFTKTHNIPGMALFLDFEKAFDSIEWNYQPTFSAYFFPDNVSQHALSMLDRLHSKLEKGATFIR